MIKVKCFHCSEEWELSQAETNACPRCGWIVEIYLDPLVAMAVVEISNRDSSSMELAGSCPLIGISGTSVSFPSRERLAEVAESLWSILDR